MIRFGDCRYDPVARELRHGQRVVELTPKAFDLLGILLETRPRVLDKEELRERLWPDVAVGDTSLAKLVSELRQATGDDAREPRFIRTVHRLGYSFCGEAIDDAGSGAVSLRPDPGPYPGLSAFTGAQAASFFGREAAVSSLWEKLSRRRLLAVIGPSGAGKTSFLHAGVFPARPDGWAVAAGAPGASPFLQLGQALAPQLAGDPGALQELLRFDDADAVVRVVSRWRRSHAQVLLAVDQLEELFTQNPSEVQRRYATLLGRLAAEADVHVLLLIRDDFLMRCHEHAALEPVFESLTPLGPLDRSALRRVLVEPARARGFAFEDEALVEAIAEAVADERGGLPPLAFAMARLWEERDRERRLLTRQAYAAIGGVAGALVRHAEQTLERIGPERQRLVREVFRNLVTALGTRAPCEREELLSVFGEHSAGEEVLQQLVDARLLTSYQAPAGDDGAHGHRVEIVHESLLREWPRLVRWRAQDEDGAVLRGQLRQAAHLWEEKGRPQDLLWSGTSLREFTLWRERYPGALTELEEQFARAMVERAQRRARLRRAAGALAVAGSLAVASAVAVSRQQAVRSAERAERQARFAEASRLVALGRNHIETYPTAALAYARRSLEVADNREARRMAVEALWRGAAARILSLEYPAWRAAFSPDGSQLVAATFSENLLSVSDTGSSRLLPGFTVPASMPWIAFTPSGDRLLTRVPGDEDALRLVSFPEGRTLRWLRPEALGDASIVHFHALSLADGVLFAVSGTDAGEQQLGLRPYDGGPFRTLGALPGPHAGIALGPTRLVVARDGRLRVRPVAGGVDTPERPLGTHDAETRFLSMGPREEKVAFADGSGHLTVAPLVGEGEMRSVVMETPEPQCPPSFDAAGTRLAWASSGRRVVAVWDLEGPPDAGARELRRPDTAMTKAVLFHPEGQWLAATHGDQMTLWSVGQPWSRVLTGHESGVRRLRFTPDSRQLVSCAMNDGVSVWPLAPSAGSSRRRLVDGDGSPDRLCYEMALDPEGRRALWGASAVSLSALDGRQGQWLVPDWPGSDVVFHAAAFDPKGHWIATAEIYSRSPGEKRFRIWNREMSGERHWPQAPAGEDGGSYAWGVYEMEVLPDGDLLAAGQGGLRRINPESGPVGWVWPLPADEFARFALGAAGQRLVGFRSTERYPPVGSAFLLDPRGAAGPRLLPHRGREVSALALDASGEVLVTGDARGAVRAGHLAGGEPHLLLGHDGLVTSVAVSPDGRWIASAAGSEIRLWPMPDLRQPPLQALTHDALMEELRSFTNLEVVEDTSAPTGYRLAIGPFPGWQDLPTW